jgi:hypothetical protein
MVHVHAREFSLIDLPEDPSLYVLCRRWALECTDRIPIDAYFTERKTVDHPDTDLQAIHLHVRKTIYIIFSNPSDLI